MPSTPRYVTALVSALNLRKPQPDLLRTLDDSEWEQLLVFGDQMHLTIPLAEACGDFCPSWVRARVERNLADNSQRFQVIKTTYAEIADALRDANVDNLVLKGFTKAPEYVPDPRHRIQSDIDLFCPPESIFRARDALSASKPNTEWMIYANICPLCAEKQRGSGAKMLTILKCH